MTIVESPKTQALVRELWGENHMRRANFPSIPGVIVGRKPHETQQKWAFARLGEDLFAQISTLQISTLQISTLIKGGENVFRNYTN